MIARVVLCTARPRPAEADSVKADPRERLLTSHALTARAQSLQSLNLEAAPSGRQAQFGEVELRIGKLLGVSGLEIPLWYLWRRATSAVPYLTWWEITAIVRREQRSVDLVVLRWCNNS
jgi:hypothetical protein